MREDRRLRFGAVVVAGPGRKDSGALCDALAAAGFTVGGGPAAVGLWCFDAAAPDADDRALTAVELEEVRALRRRCDAVALVGVGIEECPEWPSRMAVRCAVLDRERALPVFAVALRVALDGDRAASGLDDLCSWAVAESDAVADAELARRDTAERLAGLRVGSAAVRTWAGGRIHAGFREVASAGQPRAASVRAADVPGFTRWVRCAVGDLEERLVAAVAEQAAHLRATALAGLCPYERAVDPAPSAAPASAGPEWPERPWGAEDAVIVLIGASSGLGVGRLAAGFLAGWVPGWAAVWAAVLIGVCVAAGAVALRRRVVLRAQARAWVAEVVADARARTEWRAAALLNGVEPAVAARMRRAAQRSAGTGGTVRAAGASK